MSRRTKFILVMMVTSVTLGCTMQAEQENIPQTESVIVTRISNDEVEVVSPDTNQIMKERYDIVEDPEPVVEHKKETKDDGWIDVNLHISYYTSLNCENTSYGAVDAKGNKLKFGTIAIPRDLPLGTEFRIDDYDSTFYGTDRGSTKYIKWIDNNTMKIDMHIPRNKGESDAAYYKRVNNMGVTKTKGRYKLLEE